MWGKLADIDVSVRHVANMSPTFPTKPVAPVAIPLSPALGEGPTASPLVAAVQDPSSQDEEVEPSFSEFVMLTISFPYFLGGVNPARG